jgi:hypothetical protein
VFYRPQKEFFENGASALQSPERLHRPREEKQKWIEFVEKKVLNQGRGFGRAEISMHPPVVLIHSPTALSPVVELTSSHSQPADESSDTARSSPDLRRNLNSSESFHRNPSRLMSASQPPKWGRPPVAWLNSICA